MRTILVIIPYDHIYPPVNGGMQRCFHVLHQLALHFQVSAIVNQRKGEFEAAVEKYPALKSVKVYSTASGVETRDLFSIFPQKIKNALRYRWYKKSITGTTDSNFLKYYMLLKKTLRKTTFDAVVLENLDTLNAVSVIRAFTKNTPIFYDAHNVDSSLLAGQLSEMANTVLRAEKNLHKQVNGVFACSDVDLQQLRLLNDEQLQGTVIPNGVWLDEKFYDCGVQRAENNTIIFCGSLGYAPNAEALEWFYGEAWPTLKRMVPGVRLLVVGSGHLPNSLQQELKDPAIIFTGPVVDVKSFYEQAAVSVVPLKSGSGTRLKVLEAMGLGIPVVSTSKGAEGIAYTQGKDIVIADEGKEFGKEIALLLTDKNKRLSIQSAARDLVASVYDWNIIGRKLASYLNEQGPFA